jgi:hypothetical protein
MLIAAVDRNIERVWMIEGRIECAELFPLLDIGSPVGTVSIDSICTPIHWPKSGVALKSSLLLMPARTCNGQSAVQVRAQSMFEVGMKSLKGVDLMIDLSHLSQLNMWEMIKDEEGESLFLMDSQLRSPSRGKGGWQHPWMEFQAIIINSIPGSPRSPFKH